MSRWTEHDLRAYTTRRLKDEARARERMQNANRNQSQVFTAIAEPALGQTLDRDSTREAPSSFGPAQRFKITFIVRARRPCDWDNWQCKYLQDLLITIGAIPGDSWKVLQGQVISCKANSEEDEGTKVVIETI